MRKYYFFAMISLSAIFVIGPAEFQHTDKVKCLDTYDGDTVLVDWRGKREKLRIALIDAPELNQKEYKGNLPVGLWSKEFLQKFCRRDWVLRGVGREFYGRLLARAEVNDVDVGQTMLSEGHAVIYERAIFPNSNLKTAYWQAMMKAKREKKGFWGTKGLLSPYKFRHSARQKTSKRVSYRKLLSQQE